jgi:hypothetical protein
MTINVEKQKLWHFGLGFTDFVYICNVFAKQLYADLVCVYEKSAQMDCWHHLDAHPALFAATHIALYTTHTKLGGAKGGILCLGENGHGHQRRTRILEVPARLERGGFQDDKTQ